MKKDLMMAKLSQFSFADIKAFRELTEEELNKEIDSADGADAIFLKEEKADTLAIINQVISQKICKFHEE